jgi:hypothetical protein
MSTEKKQTKMRIALMRMTGWVAMFMSFAAAADGQEITRDAIAKDVVGIYIGPFGPNVITMQLQEIAGETVFGQTEVGKNKRPFRGVLHGPQRRCILRSARARR